MKVKLMFLILILCIKAFGQTPIDVSEQTIKIAALSEEIIYFGFAEGDQIVFNFTEVDGKELKEIEIVEFPAASKFSDFKTSKIENKAINVNSKAVYKFRFYNSSLGGRVCKIKIQRIPSDEKLKGFNTAIKWVKEQDTTWNSYPKDILIGYDTLKTSKSRKVLEIEEKKEEFVIDKTERVHSISNENSNKSVVFFTLPQNQISDYDTKKVVAWAYWVGVGEESNLAWQQNAKIISSTIKTVAKSTMSPLGAIAIGTVTDLMLPKLGEDVGYSLVDETNKNFFFAGSPYKGYDFGNGIAGYKRFLDPNLLQGKFYVALKNDNYVLGIDVNIKVSAIIEHKKYKDETYIEKTVTPKYEKKIVKEPVITTREFPATFDYKR